MEPKEKSGWKGYGLQIFYDVLLMIGVFSCVLYLFLTVMSLAAGTWLWGLLLAFAAFYLAAVFCLGIANIIQSFGKHRRDDVLFCVNAMLILKYGLVIFFIVNFVLILAGFLFTGLIALVASRGTIIFAFPLWIPAILAGAGVCAFLTWLAMLPGAFYGIQVIRFSLREGKISGKEALLHGVLQFVFLADVLDARYLAVKKWDMGKKSSRVVVGLYVLGIVVLAAGILFLWFGV